MRMPGNVEPTDIAALNMPTFFRTLFARLNNRIILPAHDRINS
jgi:hypothetical protein